MAARQLLFNMEADVVQSHYLLYGSAGSSGRHLAELFERNTKGLLCAHPLSAAGVIKVEESPR